MTPVVEIEGLCKRYGEVVAVDALSMAIEPGELMGFLGPNGAGKTTTISILATLLRPTSGRATVCGHDVVHDRPAVRRRIGLVFQEVTLDNHLTAQENLWFHAILYGLSKQVAFERMGPLLDLVGLADRATAQVGTFSGGMKRRLEIARGLMHLPRVLFLDEPTIGLDPQTRIAVWDHVESVRRNEDVTIFLTTHYMDEAERCDRIAIIDQGQLVALGSPTDLKAAIGHDRVTVATTDDRAALAELRAASFDGELVPEGVCVQVEDGEAAVPALVSRLTVGVKSVRVRRPSLDDVFISFTGKAIRDGAPTAGEQLTLTEVARSAKAAR